MKGGRTNLKRGLSILLACLFTFSMFATSIAQANKNTVNARLGTSSFKVEKTGTDNVDSAYFKSEFTDVSQLVEAREALNIEIAQEGTVLFKNNGALPLNMSSEKVTIWGLNSIAPTFGGLIGSTSDVNPEVGQKTITLIDAMKARGFPVNDEMIALYHSEAAQPYYRFAAFYGKQVPGHSLEALLSRGNPLFPALCFTILLCDPNLIPTRTEFGFLFSQIS